jgi:predicted PurR-regulated permease PerM
MGLAFMTIAAPRTSIEPDFPLPRRMTLPHSATIIGAAAVLYVAQDIFLPLAIAMLITFALSPLVTKLRQTGLPLIASVLAVVAAAVVAMTLFALVVSSQLGQLAQNLPTFRANIITKVDSLKSAGGEGSLVSRLSEMITAINTQIGAAMPGDGTVVTQPMPVEVVENTTAFDLLMNLVLPLISPVATSGLVIVLVCFMLLEREQLRERFIRLVGSNDLYRTTQVLEEAGSRVGNYLLTQLLVNIIYAVPIAIGLWLIGVPNALLWGMLTLVLRFVPYIGSALSAAFPLFLSFAVSPDWSAVLWTAALFALVELLTSNVIEPWLYGSRTGVSPLAIIVSAIFWTFLWGPLGLVMSTPLTVCLVVLGRHIPQFELFDILFGDEPVLAPYARLYQRLLVGDRMEATFRAEEAMEDEGLADFYQNSAIPALLLAQDDRDRGVLTPTQEARLAETASGMVEDLATLAQPDTELPTATTRQLRVACIGGRWATDDVSARMLVQVLAGEGVETAAYSFADLAPARLNALNLVETDCLILCFLDPTPSRASLLHVRRIKRLAPNLRVGVMIWDMPGDIQAQDDGFRGVAKVSAVKRAEAVEFGADFVGTMIAEAVEAAFVDEAPIPVPAATLANRPAARRTKQSAA